MSIALILFAVSVALSAAAISTLLWRQLAAEPPGPWERAASIAVMTFVVAIAVNWSLSWLGLLARTPLLVAALALGVPAGAYAIRRRAFAALRLPHLALGQRVVLYPLLLWVVFAVWRGAVVPVLSHDALGYHFPKAVMIARAQQYQFFNAPDPRIPTSPGNYEMLLADVLLLSGSDAVTEWVSTFAFLTFLLLAAAVVERWWGRGSHAIGVILLLSAVPVVLLHIGAHKNDMLSNVFYLGALLWAGRWFVTRELAPLVLALLCLGAAGGTKIQAVFVAAALVAVWLWRVVRGRMRPTLQEAGLAVASIPLTLLLLGAWAYVLNVTQTGQAALPASSSSDAGYGDWHNVWQVPLLLTIRPFDPSDRDVYVPWRGERWFWPRYEFYFSDFGAPATLLAFAVPFACRRYWRRFGSRRTVDERVAGTVAALLSVLLMLPIRIRPLGFYAGFPRYFMFIVIFVLAWTLAPVLKEAALRRKRAVVQTGLVLCAAVLVANAGVYAREDLFQPLDYVRFIAQHPHIRVPNFADYRAGTLVDQLAGPHDTIAFHGGFDSWIYPAYGRDLTRTVKFIDANTPIPPDAKYVAIDRAWNIIWGHPEFRHMGEYKRYLGQGAPTGEDLAIFEQLQARPEEFELVRRAAWANQAVFRRRGAEQPQPRSAAQHDGSSR
jgi:hypothetical protein